MIYTFNPHPDFFLLHTDMTLKWMVEFFSATLTAPRNLNCVRGQCALINYQISNEHISDMLQRGIHIPHLSSTMRNQLIL
jgi:hypothetical protein